MGRNQGDVWITQTPAPRPRVQQSSWCSIRHPQPSQVQPDALLHTCKYNYFQFDRLVIRTQMCQVQLILQAATPLHTRRYVS